MHPGYIYVIRCHDTVKVGHSYQPNIRRVGLPQAYGVKLKDLELRAKFQAQKPLERMVHQALKSYRIFREWYVDGPWIEPIIQSVLQKYSKRQ